MFSRNYMLPLFISLSPYLPCMILFVWTVFIPLSLLENNLYASIPIVVISETPPRPDRLGRRSGNKPHDLLRHREEKKNKIFQSRKKANKQYSVLPLIKQIVCTFTGERGEILLKLWGVH